MTREIDYRSTVFTERKLVFTLDSTYMATRRRPWAEAIRQIIARLTK